MKIINEMFPGVFVIEPKKIVDSRGAFIKTFQASRFRDLGIDFSPEEEFYSVSDENVIRGMHFQRPPFAHAKMVYCIKGAVTDVVVDLRSKSSMYGCCRSVELSEENGLVLFISVGYAHGFLCRKDRSVMVYKTSVEYAPSSDAGINWKSIDYNWNLGGIEPRLSARDQSFQAFSEFRSPF